VVSVIQVARIERIKMETILKTSEHTDKFWPDFVKAVGTIEDAKKTSENGHRHYKYADLNQCYKAVKPTLKENNLAIIQSFGVRDGVGVLETRVVHNSGQWIANQWSFGLVTDMQKLGAMFTYLKRYTLSAMLCLASDEDTDGEIVNKQTGKVEIVHQGEIRSKQYNAMTDPFDKSKAGHVIVLTDKLKQWQIDPSLFKESIEQCHGKTADQWSEAVKSLNS
jgi:hypothetical protein